MGTRLTTLPRGTAILRGVLNSDLRSERAVNASRTSLQTALAP